jgi:beta-N-acetylhexosaminidase
VLALAAGCDALCVGGGLAGEEVVDAIAAAIVEAVNDGRLSEGRLTEAAERVDALAAWRRRQQSRAVERPDLGLSAARQALRADGPVHVGDDVRVVRFDVPASIAAGAVPWGIEAELMARGAKVTESGSSVVLLVRDLHRHPEQKAEVDAWLARRPDAVVVEMGLPVCRPERALAYIATYGASRASAIAAAEVMSR